MSLGPTLAWAPSLSCASGIIRQLIVEREIKRKYLNLCFGQNIIQLRIKWTIGIVTKYHVVNYL